MIKKTVKKGATKKEIVLRKSTPKTKTSKAIRSQAALEKKQISKVRPKVAAKKKQISKITPLKKRKIKKITAATKKTGKVKQLKKKVVKPAVIPKRVTTAKAKPKKILAVKKVFTPPNPKALSKTIPAKEITKPVKRKPSAMAGPLPIKPYQPKKNEVYMSEDQLQHFVRILNIWKKQLMEEVDRTIYDMQDVTNYADPVDRASQEEEFNLKLRERDRERKLLKKIDEALVRIKEGNYGYCDECGAEIGIRRLEARPTATQCIECKTITEIREKQTGR